MEDNFLLKIFPDHEVLLEINPEELGGVILEYLNSIPASERNIYLRKDVFCAEIGIQGYPTKSHEKIKQVLAEAWGYLEKELLIIMLPGDITGNYYFITRQGQKIGNKNDFESYRKANLIPRGLLHPEIYRKIWGAFLRGDYDTSIFIAFREVEVAARTAGGYNFSDYGDKLMRKAFDEKDGLLTDYSLPVPERLAMSHLFAGAIGLYKNPQSHRIVNLSDVSEVVALLFFASQLMNIIDRAKNESDNFQ